jgi:homoserine O-succinyltransferase
VFFQGHPEYDTVSLFKEYKREVSRFAAGERRDYPPFPENYIRLRDRAILEEHRDRVIGALDRGEEPPQVPESHVLGGLDNTWHDTAEGVLGNWVGQIYQITNIKRRLPFMEGVNPKDPLGLGW